MKAESPMQICEGICCEQGVLISADSRLADGDVSSQSVEIDGGFNGPRWIFGMLGKHRRDHPGEQVSAPAFGHARVSGGVDGDGSIRMGYEGAPALQDQSELVLRREFACNFEAVDLDFRNAEADEAGHFTWVRGASALSRDFSSLRYTKGNGFGKVAAATAA